MTANRPGGKSLKEIGKEQDAKNGITHAPKPEETKPQFRVVFARLPMDLTALCAKKTGMTSDECYQILRPLSENEGIPGVERQVYEVWGITHEEWREIRPLYDNPEPARKDVAPNGARIVHTEKAKPEIKVDVSFAEIHSYMIKSGANMARIEEVMIIEDAKAVIKEQKPILKEAQRQYDLAANAIETVKRGVLDIARADPEWQAWRRTMTDEEWAVELEKFLVTAVDEKRPDLRKQLEDSRLAVLQAQSEIEAAEVTIENLTAKEA